LLKLEAIKCACSLLPGAFQKVEISDDTFCIVDTAVLFANGPLWAWGELNLGISMNALYAAITSFFEASFNITNLN
jgi:hypothetical protein